MRLYAAQQRRYVFVLEALFVPAQHDGNAMSWWQGQIQIYSKCKVDAAWPKM